MAISLGELATQFDCELVGDAKVTVDNVASLHRANARSLSFLSSATFKQQLSGTAAAAVILRAEDAADAPSAALISNNPYASYARMAAVICPEPGHEFNLLWWERWAPTNHRQGQPNQSGGHLMASPRAATGKMSPLPQTVR